MLQVAVSANKGEPCAGKCSLGGEVVVRRVGEDGRYALLDAYAVVAYLRDEHAAVAVEAILQSDACAVTALGFAEVIDRMVRLDGVAEDELARDLADLGLFAVAWVVDQVLASTVSLDLSPGCC